MRTRLLDPSQAFGSILLPSAVVRMTRKRAALTVLIIAVVAGGRAEAEMIDLKANFHLLGEVNRFAAPGFGFGDMGIHFGVDQAGAVPEIGSIAYSAGGGAPDTTGVLAPLTGTLPSGTGFGIVDLSFWPLTLTVGQASSMYHRPRRQRPRRFLWRQRQRDPRLLG